MSEIITVILPLDGFCSRVNKNYFQRVWMHDHDTLFKVVEELLVTRSQDL